MSLFAKAGVLWSKTTAEINLYLNTTSNPPIDALFKMILDDLDLKQLKNDQQDATLGLHETRISTLEAQMPIALAS